MLKRFVIASTLASALGLMLSTAALAGKTYTGRIVSYSATSLSVLDKEVVTFTLDDKTAFTKMLTQKPWEQDTRLDARAFAVGRYVAVHVRPDGSNVADWVQVATDLRVTPSATTVDCGCMTMCHDHAAAATDAK